MTRVMPNDVVGRGGKGLNGISFVGIRNKRKNRHSSQNDVVGKTVKGQDGISYVLGKTVKGEDNISFVGIRNK